MKQCYQKWINLLKLAIYKINNIIILFNLIIHIIIISTIKKIFIFLHKTPPAKKYGKKIVLKIVRQTITNF